MCLKSYGLGQDPPPLRKKNTANTANAAVTANMANIVPSQYSQYSQYGKYSSKPWFVPLGPCFQCSKPSCLALLSPKTNFVLIQKFQFHTIFNISNHIDLASITLFRRDMIMITYLMVLWKPFLTKVCFNHTQKVSKNAAKICRKERQSQFSKKRGGVRRGMIMITDSMGFFFYAFPKRRFGELRSTKVTSR